MTGVVVVCSVLLAAAGVLAVIRAERGPSMLDRTIALDILTTTLVAFVGLEAAWSRRTDTVPVLVALSLVGFVGSVTIARFASKEPPGEGRVRTAEEIARDEAALLGLETGGGDRPGPVARAESTTRTRTATEAGDGPVVARHEEVE